MKLKKNLSLFAQTAWMLSGAGRVAMMLLVMLFSMTAQTAWAQNNIVTQANFSNFFDQDGNLLDAVTSDELIFQGEISDLAPIITIGRALTLTGDNAVLNNMALRITSDDVTVTGFTLNENDADFTDDNDGAAIYVSGSDVTLDGVSVTYNAPDEVEAKAIFTDGAENFKLINSEIIFTGANPEGYHYRGLEVRNSDGAKIDNNTISAVLPVVDVDYSKGGGTIDPDLVLAVGIQGGDNVEFTNNTISVNTKGAIGDFPTIDAVMIYSTNNILIKGNDITHLDTTTPTDDNPRYYYGLDIYSTTGTVEANDIILNTTTTADVVRAGTAYAIQVTDPIEFTIKDNNITAVSKGLTAGIFVMDYYNSADLTVENNNIDVTGYFDTTSMSIYSVAGIEAETNTLKAYNNTITVANGAVYDDANNVYGVSMTEVINEGASPDIKDNTITVDGKYAVYYAKAVNANVTGNTLIAHELTGDAAVYIKSGNNNTVKDNLLGYVIPKTGESTYNIPANVSSFKVYDDGGLGRTYSPGCAGTLTLTAPEGYRLQLSGSIKTEQNDDYLTVYDGSSNEADVLIDQMSSSSNGTQTAIPTVISTGQSLTLYFCSNSSDSGDSEFDGLDLTVTVINEANIVTQDNFFSFFDEDGELLETVESDELIFQGEFSDLSDVIITKPITITGDKAVLNNMGFVIASEDVALDNMKLVATTSLGSLITVTKSNVDLTNLDISYIVEDEEAIAIDVRGTSTLSDINISNNNIYFESHVSDDERYATAINLEDVEDVIIDGNIISASVPALYVKTSDNTYFMLGLVYVNPIRIYEASDLEFINNKVDVTVNESTSSYPTAQAMYLVGSEDVLIQGITLP